MNDLIREPGCDDDVGDDDEVLVPLGFMLEHIRLERRVAELERLDETIAMIKARMDECMRAALTEVVTGKRNGDLERAGGSENASNWRFLARLEIERAHGGVDRVWVDGVNGERGDYRSVLRERCGRGCRWCPAATSVRRAA